MNEKKVNIELVQTQTKQIVCKHCGTEAVVKYGAYDFVLVYHI